MKKFFIVFISICTVLLSGCNNRDLREHTTNITDPLLANFDDFDVANKKYIKYNADVCDMRTNRIVEIGMTQVFQYNNSVSIDISSEYVNESNNACFAASGYCPVNSLQKMTGTKTFDEALTSVGQPYFYSELGDRCALLLADEEQTLIYGDGNDFLKIALGGKHTITGVKSIQITDDRLFVFNCPRKKEGMSVIIRSFAWGDDTTYDEIEIPFSSMGLNDTERDVKENAVFIKDGTLFCISDVFIDQCGWITAYNLETKQYSNAKIEGIAGVQQIFCAEDGIIVLYNKYNSEGYSNNTFLYKYGFDYSSTAFSHEGVSVISFPENANYYFSTRGKDCYCVGDTFCGIMENTQDMSYAYAEFSLSTGELTTFVPFMPKSSDYVVTGLIIRDDGRAISRNNCGT